MKRFIFSMSWVKNMSTVCTNALRRAAWPFEESMTDKCVGLSWRVATYLNCDYEKFVIFKRTGKTHYSHFLGEENEIQILIFEQNSKSQGLNFNGISL